VARYIFAVLATCAILPSGFDSIAAPHRAEAMLDNVPVQGDAKQDIASVTPAIPHAPIEHASERCAA